ncbi:hypothetical protein FT663_04384 [Candidozyma haemuli var. vulneris]|uniref:Uncharacterized protein n=1 Tax=Candidozyma haemuli TaxID=45357 RepID=A0A2V1ATV9_9ASCO|nr:hypothetical protein CXQ85_000169 [[Candida] haemuloni]KAF3987622.1 hypothetical protein FT663_04384 [[Candida] haemuloni var. vulneris]KAF3992610.1 hypothetical protein FT662_00991 [[Candida] haemuloni var. vulneris]PVH21202.1 hypothetical protein CXQ85_000169 [[Candida] haemuloni]
MSRLRKVDRAILEQNEPIDTEDQELLISQLRQKNDENLTLYTRVLALSVVVELPILLWLTKTADSKRDKTLFTILIVLSSILSLLNLLYDVSAIGDHVSRRLISRDWNRNVAQVARYVLSYHGVNVLNALLLLQLGNAARQSGFKNMYCIVPVGNLIMVFLLRKWHTDIKGNVKELDGLKYDYKGV